MILLALAAAVAFAAAGYLIGLVEANARWSKSEARLRESLDELRDATSTPTPVYNVKVVTDTTLSALNEILRINRPASVKCEQCDGPCVFVRNVAQFADTGGGAWVCTRDGWQISEAGYLIQSHHESLEGIDLAGPVLTLDGDNVTGQLHEKLAEMDPLGQSS
jgi:hypothetical protein